MTTENDQLQHKFLRRGILLFGLAALAGLTWGVILEILNQEVQFNNLQQ